jgi:two-component system sensor kinase FixL
MVGAVPSAVVGTSAATVSGLRRRNRDLLASSVLQATSQHHDLDKIIDRISETLGVMLDAEFVGIVQMHQEAAERRRSDARLQELQSELSHAARFSSMGQMAGALAHELNQPLGAISNYVNAARRLPIGTTWEGSAKVLKSIHDATRRADHSSIARIRRYR